MVKRVKPLQQAFPSYGPECRNRQDILDQVKGERVSANSFKVDGRHLIWHTTPEELNRVALEFEGNCQEPGESTYVSGGQYGLTLQLPERTVGLEISTSSSYYPDLSLEVTPSALKRAAKRLAAAPWDKRPKGEEDRWGYDCKSIKSRVGDDIITVSWIPEIDQNGTPQISRMVWDAWSIKNQREFATQVNMDRSRHRAGVTLPGGKVFGARA